jgi:hypothetical protein
MLENMSIGAITGGTPESGAASADNGYVTGPSYVSTLVTTAQTR